MAVGLRPFHHVDLSTAELLNSDGGGGHPFAFGLGGLVSRAKPPTANYSSTRQPPRNEGRRSQSPTCSQRVEGRFHYAVPLPYRRLSGGVENQSIRKRRFWAVEFRWLLDFMPRRDNPAPRHALRRNNYRLEVYTFNQRECTWDGIENLGDKAIFVGTDYSFFGPTGNFFAWNGNCIIFHKESFPSYRGSFYPDNSLETGTAECAGICIYNLGDERCIPISRYEGYFEVFRPRSSWFSYARH